MAAMLSMRNEELVQLVTEHSLSELLCGVLCLVCSW